MSRKQQPIVGIFAALLLAAALFGCASSKDPSMPAGAVAEVASQPITQAGLSHWMSTIAGGDFYEIAHIQAPRGLASDPPNYPACIAAMRSLLRIGTRHAPKLASGQLRGKCEEFDAAVEQQTLSFLIVAYRAVTQGAELGVTVDGAEIDKDFDRIKAEQFPTQSELRTYLAKRGWSVSDELFLIKKDLLSTRMLTAVHQKYATEEQLKKYLEGASRRLQGQVDCRPNYVVEQCRQYKAATAAPPPRSPAIQIEALVQERPSEPAPRLSPDLNCKNTGHGKLACEKVFR